MCALKAYNLASHKCLDCKLCSRQRSLTRASASLMPHACGCCLNAVPHFIMPISLRGLALRTALSRSAHLPSCAQPRLRAAIT